MPVEMMPYARRAVRSWAEDLQKELGRFGAQMLGGVRCNTLLLTIEQRRDGERPVCDGFKQGDGLA
jgi:hypothetical protein